MLNVLTADESEQAIKKITDKHPEETRRMKVWLDEQIKQGKKKPHSTVVTLTPVLAQLLLDRNAVNRPMIRRNLSDLAADITNDRFQFNGESIIISDTGILLDGQHRCQQVVITGKLIEVVLVFGPKETARETIDTGKSKTVGNYLAMRGKKYSNVMASAVSLYLQYSRHGRVIPTSDFAITPTKADILTAAADLKSFDKSIEVTAGCTKSLRCHAVMAFCHYIFKHRASVSDADEFMHLLIEGDGLRKGTPIYYCREKMFELTGTARPSTRVELIFKCWNAWRLGENITRVKLTGVLPKLER